MPREKGFSEEQTKKKQELIEKYGYVVLEDIKGDIIVKDPENITIECAHSKTSLTNLVVIHDALMRIREYIIR